MAGPKLARVVTANGERAVWRLPTARKKILVEAEKAAKDMPAQPSAYQRALVRGPRINLHPRYSHSIVADAQSLRRRIMASKPAKRSKEVAAEFEKLTADQMEELVKFVVTNSGEIAARGAVKGLTLELITRKMPQFEELLRRLERKLAKEVGYEAELVIVRRARTRTATGSGEVADYLIIAQPKPGGGKKTWVMAAVESKSETNAIEIVSKGSREAMPERGMAEVVGNEFGQPEHDVRRIKRFGLDLDSAVAEGGLDAAELGKLRPEDIRMRHEAGLPPEQQTTELIGVVPPNLRPGTYDLIRNRASAKGVQIWTHPVDGRDARDVAEDLIRAVNEK